MKHLLFYICLLLLCVSCIEEFNELPGDAGDPMLVVEGEIVSGKSCVFTLRQSATLGDMSNYHYQNCLKAVTGSLRLDCSDGSSIESSSYKGIDGSYCIDVPLLDPDKTYTLSVFTDELGDYHSEPMKPLFAPGIDTVFIDMPNNDGQVHFYLSTVDPQGKTYYMWYFDEYYEVFTPIVSMWDYNIGTHEFYVRKYPIHQGWISVLNNQPVIGSNESYGNHAIKELSLYQRDKQELRFRTKYMVIVKQAAISVEEYEYHRLLRIQSNQTGDIFGAMPSELPSNLKTNDGKRAIGYVGIRGSVAEKSLIVGPKEVGYVENVACEFPSETQISDNPAVMINGGWAIRSYGPSGITWTKAWCVDCRKSYWDGGASLTKPDVWPF